LERDYEELTHTFTPDTRGETCDEHTLLFQVMSGLHTSINSHIANGFEDPKTGDRTSNQTYFLERVGDHPDRIKNLYFTYAAVLRAISLAEVPFLDMDYDTQCDASLDSQTPIMVRQLLRTLAGDDCDAFQEKSLFKTELEQT